MFTVNPEKQIEIDNLAKVLNDTPIRGMATYAELSAAVGYNVQEKPFSLMKARRRVEGETGLRFSTVKGEGVKKLDGAAVAAIGAQARKSIAKKARRQAGRLTGLKYNDIDAAGQRRIDAERSLLGAISATAKADVAKIEEQTNTGPLVATRVFDVLGRF